MHKNPDLLLKRRQFIRMMVNKSKHPAATVDKLSKRLFLHPQTIYKDLRQSKKEVSK